MSAVYDTDDGGREAALRARGIKLTKPDAQTIPLDHPARKGPPLGLAPIGDDTASFSPYASPYDNGEDLDHGPIVDLDTLDPKVADAAADMRFVHFCLNVAGSLTTTLSDRTKAKLTEVRSEIARVELENARLKATVAELTAKVDTLTFVSERLRIENAGPIGPQGAMGRDGHEGRPGARGERGERGERGLPAPTFAAWDVDAARFVITPCYSDGTRGVPLNLLGLFQTYDSAVSDIEDRDLESAAAASRAETERQAEAFRQGR